MYSSTHRAVLGRRTPLRGRLATRLATAPNHTRNAVLVALALALLVALAPWATHLASDGPPSGLRVGGEPLAGGGEARAAIEAKARRYLSAPMELFAGTHRERLARRELGARIDTRALAGRAANIARSKNPFHDLPLLVRVWTGRVDLAWDVSVDRAALEEVVERLAVNVDREPRGAHLDHAGRVLELSADGARLDRARARRDIARALRDGRRSLPLFVERLSSGVGARALPSLVDAPPEVVIASFETRFRTAGSEADRAHNVRTAARYLDGARIPALGRLGFNEQVGARSRERGYRIAHVILDGEMVDGLGGGVCQVASTLHAAAFLAGMNIVDHTPHSRPSEYIPMGLDATVVWPSTDLVIANPFPFEVRVRAIAEEASLRIELIGRTRPAEVRWHTEVLATSGYSDRFVEDPAVPAGRERVSQRGIRGYVVRRERTISGGPSARVEETRIRYPATDRIVRVAPGSLDPVTGLPAFASEEPVELAP